MRTIDPGESLTYQLVATNSGAWLYHCSTMPIPLHVANGMFGAVIIDPPNLAAVDTEVVLVHSELYPGAQGGTADEAKIAAGILPRPATPAAPDGRRRDGPRCRRRSAQCGARPTPGDLFGHTALFSGALTSARHSLP